MPAANVIQLRQLLAEKFPGLRMRAEPFSAAPRPCHPSGLPQIDGPLRGGLPQGALTEIVAPAGTGGALLLSTLLQRALSQNLLAALIDGQDCFDVPGNDLSRLLWVRCRSATEALKAADLLLRDGNLPLVLLDLAINPAVQLRKIPATTWYRLQRLAEQTSATTIIFTPRAMVSPAQARLTLHSHFSLDALERDPEALLPELQVEVAELHRGEERVFA
jgi:hypothetical protein